MRWLKHTLTGDRSRFQTDQAHVTAPAVALNMLVWRRLMHVLVDVPLPDLGCPVQRHLPHVVTGP